MSTNPSRPSRCSTDDDLDLALTYDYNLAPASPGPAAGDRRAVVGSVGTRRARRSLRTAGRRSPTYADRTWIVNSRNTADEDAVRTLASLAGFVPRIAHEIDSLELVEDLIVAGYGVGLLPIGRPTDRGVKVLPLSDPKVMLTAYAVTRRGRATWPPLRAVLDRTAAAAGGRCRGRTGRAPPRDREESGRVGLSAARARGCRSTTGGRSSGHCRCTTVPWLLSRYCQCVAQFVALLAVVAARRPRLATGALQPGAAARSAVGSIGNTTHRPIRQHTCADQLVVDPLLLLVEIGVQHVVRLVLLGEHRDRVPVVADRLEHGGAPAGLVQRQVVGEVEVGHRAPPSLQSAI